MILAILGLGQLELVRYYDTDRWIYILYKDII